MAWQEPKTDWTSADRVTAGDMNRIAGNLNILYPSGQLKENYTQNDFVTVSQWNAILTSLRMLNIATRLSAEIPGSDMTAETFNAAEDITGRLKERMELLLKQDAASIYTGDDLYTDENYARGL